MRIAICDDDRNLAEDLAAFVREIHDEKQKTDIDIFEHPRKFISAIARGATIYDVIFLDIMMPDIDGMGVAQKIRELNKFVPIIFVTFHDKYAIEAFDYFATGFLVKPVTRESVRKVLDRLWVMIQSEENTCILDTVEGKVAMPLYCIIYGESEAHKTRIHTIRGDFLCSFSLKQFLVSTTSPLFVRCHRAYFVNLDYISYFERRERLIFLKSGGSIDISRNYLDSTIEAFMRRRDMDGS